ncbi:MAG TPA: phospho-N-acetylmuramoyl-pentapeptide-transferase [Actinomycetota bacterium]|nr:phospho-N-acetylmuramoyl-pentapeptide-transferase [Actinomycetota bacterium]
MQGLLVATAIAMAFALVGTPWLIELFRARGVGQLIREDGPAAHFVKHGTPTMGGLVLLIAATIGYVLSHVRLSGFSLSLTRMHPQAGLVLGAGWALGLLGAMDDLTKIRHRRSLGLNKRAKVAGQVIAGCALVYGAITWGDVPSQITWRGFALAWFEMLPPIVFAGWVLLLIVGTSNAVNLTDGLDGLASGASAMAFFVFTIIGYWMARHPGLYLGARGASFTDPRLLDVAVVSAAFLGACIGFLWWNAAPARIFMGDTGSLALGGVLAALSLMTRTQLLLVVIGGLFAVETLSVIVQVVSYRLFGGRRVFAMAPLHHHFELRGWAEFTVIVRFWLIAALLSGLGLALFYLEYLARGGLEV